MTSEQVVQQLLSWAKDSFSEFQEKGRSNHIDEAIALDRRALDLCPYDHFNRRDALVQLGHHLYLRYKQCGDMTDIQEGIVVEREALKFFSLGHPDRSVHLSSLAIHLSFRYDQLGEMEDLVEAIALGKEALDLLPPGHWNRSIPLNNLAAFIFTRYLQLGEMSDVNEAIVLGQEAVDLNQPGYPCRFVTLSNLANGYSRRYRQLGAIADLDRAIFFGHEALQICPSLNPDHSRALNILSCCLSEKYVLLGAMADLDEAIDLELEALGLRPRGHPLRGMTLGNAANDFYERFLRLDVLADVDKAIVLGLESVDLHAPGHPRRSGSLTNVACCFFARYRRVGGMADLEEAIVLGKNALDHHPPGHSSDRSPTLNNLTSYLYCRFDALGHLKDKEDLFNLYTKLALVPQSVTSLDVDVSKSWIYAAEEFQHPTLLLAYETSLRLLVHHLATLPSLPQHLPVLRKLTSSLAVDAFSACLRNYSPKDAIELLEQGRGVFWNQISRLRSPLEDVIASGTAGKTLADEFSRVTSHIHDVMNSSGSDQHDQLCRHNLDLQGIINDIRKLPGLTRFLLPSPFSDLQQAVNGGPVIILNASKYTCDALVVFSDKDPVHIPLQITKIRVQDLASELHSLTLRAKTMDVTRDLGQFLRDLWDEVLSPIVGFLQTTVPVGSRIWWCPTAEFSLLPLHAAGPYRRAQPNLPQLYISSYTPTLTALIRARHDPSTSITRETRFLAVGQATADGESELASVGSELNIVAQRVDGLAAFARVEGPEACISRVSKELQKHEWVHLACHGIPNRNAPFESAFALHDGHFTIQHIMHCELENPKFAYLSACHTTVGDEESPDEVIHLATAMQFAGFRSVIGTMWAVDDGETNKIAAMFYQHMVDESGRLDHTRAAFALNKTMNDMVDIPLDQRILYLHIGA